MAGGRSLQQAKSEQGDLGWSHTDATDDCPDCGGDAITVSRRNQPVDRPLKMDGYTIHVHAKTAYYHQDDG